MSYRKFVKYLYSVYNCTYLIIFSFENSSEQTVYSAIFKLKYYIPDSK